MLYSSVPGCYLFSSEQMLFCAVKVCHGSSQSHFIETPLVQYANVTAYRLYYFLVNCSSKIFFRKCNSKILCSDQFEKNFSVICVCRI